ncbi:hypothetical protein C475_20238 [Halosimplex carlsbadense 2-9-1]|uniref:DUF7310 domain-containing protein n=1 Tax=Halosimplex carlsbadense 2-9-1 TaxID=797114 RepID=M0CFG8_9EURY|nr:hypothetical protein [Halosimplex carlsbadense]ELZ20629.1 hypothetical protein C475_20238 [Halosimplex carlsbadense 2-9-1]
MSERDLDARLDAVERALTDGDTDLRELRDRSGVVDDVQTLEARLESVESRLDELEAGLEAVRGYAGNVRAVNREVERRASAALAKAETVEAAVGNDGTARGRSEERPGNRSPDRVGHGEPQNDAHAKPPSDRSSTGPTGTTPDPSAAGRNGATSAGRDLTDPNGSAHDDGSRHTGRGQPDDPQSGDDRRGRVVRDDDRSRRDGSAGSSSESESDGGTEQFIERVRDAL